jgi:hypothetical protein
MVLVVGALFLPVMPPIASAFFVSGILILALSFVGNRLAQRSSGRQTGRAPASRAQIE